jgi:hypothetical protein
MSFGLLFVALSGFLLVTSSARIVAQEKESRAKQPRPPRTSPGPQPLALKLEGRARDSREYFESARRELEVELREVLHQKNRKGMDYLEVTIGPGSESEDRLNVALLARDFVPESAGPWDKQDVLFFQASGGPVYLNLSLPQSMVQSMTRYRTRVLGKLGERAPSIETWRVTFERNSGESLGFEGRFEEGKPIIYPVLLFRGKKVDAPLSIKADGDNVTEAISRGTFPLPPLRILGEFSSTKSILEFFGKE